MFECQRCGATAPEHECVPTLAFIDRLRAERDQYRIALKAACLIIEADTETLESADEIMIALFRGAMQRV